ncbi:Zinc finger BED domain-containing protein DAYSLEEPER, partial [Pseudolycoriella hygida]
MNEDNNKGTAATDGCNVIGAEDDVVVIASTSNGPAKKRKRYSTVWNHFDTSNDDTDEWANCKYCGKRYPLSGKTNGSTSNMIRHLKHTHPDVETRTVSEEIEIIEFSQERYREALIKYIVVCNQPFTEVEQQAFLNMIHILNPAAITISSSTVKRDIMKKFEEKVRNMVAHLKNVPGKISFTIDAW